MIPQQKQLMQDALKCLHNIEVLKSLIHPVDPVICKVLVMEEQIQYTEIMAFLLTELLSIHKPIEA